METKQKKQSIKVIYTPEQFKEMGFDGEIAKFMRENSNTGRRGLTAIGGFAGAFLSKDRKCVSVNLTM